MTIYKAAITPSTLNGYPVIKHEVHANCTTVMVRKNDELIVATWWPALGSSWSWGHYFPYVTGSAEGYAKALDMARREFTLVASRNAKR